MAKFFQTTKKGEAHELKEELNSESKDKQKDAIKKVIASMTVGRDVSSLFSDVTRLISSVSIDIKKLVYLYIMNNAKSQPEKAVLLAGTFVRDSQHDSPLIRGLAIRTMSAISVEKMADYLADPLRRALRDSDPYVRKTAAIAVAKMYSINRSKVEEGGFLEMLQELLSDSNPTVVSNAVAALCEIREYSGAVGVRGASSSNDLAEFKAQTVHTLLTALNEASEWGQVYILEGLSGYQAKSADEADTIAERIIPRLQHGNAAVVLAAVKILVQYLESWGKKVPADQREEVSRKYCSKMAPPLVSLVSGGQEFEIRYVALRNVTLIIQRFPDLLTSQIRLFFVKYNDPIFIKLEKLDIMLLLVDSSTVDLCLSEFREYAQEIDVEFVRKSVRAIGRAAIKIESAAQKCIDVLLQLIKTKINYVVQEAIIVIKDIFRRYPNQYEVIIGALCENLDTLDEPDAKASMIWIIGEYAERIENADELLEMFVDTFDDETVQVRLALLTSMVKLFLKRPTNTQELLQRVLKLASDSDVPDLRDRGYVYWRLLSTDPEAAKEVVLTRKEVINDTATKYENELLDELLMHLASLASVYHKPPSTFLPDYLHAPKKVVYMEDEDEDEYEDRGDEETSDSVVQSGGGSAPPPKQAELDLLGDLDDLSLGAPSKPAQSQPAVVTDAFDLLGGPAPTPQPAKKVEAFDDFFGGGPSVPQTQAPKLERKTILTPDKGYGVQVDSAFTNTNGNIFMDMIIYNKGSQPLMGFTMQINKNVYGIIVANKLTVPEPLVPGANYNAQLQLLLSGVVAPTVDIQIALKTNAGVAYFIDTFPFQILINKGTAIEKQEFLNLWRGITQEANQSIHISNANQSVIQQKLESHGVGFVANRPNPPNNHLYYAFRSVSNHTFLLEMVVPQAGGNQATLCVKSDAPHLYPALLPFLEASLK